MSRNPKNLRRVLVTGTLAAGSLLGAAGIASAASGTSTTDTSTVATSGTSGTGTPAPGATGSAPTGAAANPATLSHGPGETLLTGTQLAEATAAATAAVPGATVIRAETNSSGDYPYEVHMAKSDGTDVTVELDSNLKVITTISGFGAGPAGSQAPAGAAPSSSTSSTTN